ncbi:MAG: MATE family efflux transporter [Lachnospiraceae bacterium]|nr:MATE family efflux transporter [Lachnospiraceae bacterium]
MSKNKSYEIDMCNGPLLGKILLFSIPLMLSGVLQLLFNAADIVVVGRFAGHQALAAVGSTSALINLLVNVFIGLSVGTNVMVANYYGAGDRERLSQTVHTAILSSIICGLALIFIGGFLAKPMLTLMGTPDDVLHQAALYMRIYFAGMPVFMLYNFGAAILRAVGDTRRPLYYLLIAGVLNVGLNLIFVIVLHMGVAGVALATVISQIVSAFLVIKALMNSDDMIRLELKKLKIHPARLRKMIRIGLPAGMQGAVFSVSNMLIQSSINSFGSIAMAGSTAAGNIEGFVYTAMNSFYQTALSFTSQNMGAGKYKRVGRILILCQICVTITGLVLGNGSYLFGRQLLGIYSSDPEVIAYGLLRMSYLCIPYFLCGNMDVMVGSLRGMGYSIMPMLVSLAGACGIRVIWIYTIFRMNHTLETLFTSYPISWIITAVVHLICFMIAYRKLKEKASA